MPKPAGRRGGGIVTASAAPRSRLATLRLRDVFYLCTTKWFLIGSLLLLGDLTTR